MKYCLAICLLLAHVNSHAALNKWVDAEGKVHYSDTVPADVQVKTLKTSAPSESIVPASGAAAPKTLAERELEWKKSQKLKEEASQKESKTQEAAAVKQKNCEGARSNLATYEHSQNIASYNSKGERTIMDDTSRKQAMDEARKAVTTYCN